MGRGGRRGGGRGGGKRWVFLAAAGGYRQHGQGIYWDSDTYYDQIDIYSTERLILMLVILILTVLSCFCVSLRSRHWAFRYGLWILILMDVTAVIVLMWLTDWTAFVVSLCFFGSVALLIIVIKIGCCLHRRLSNVKNKETGMESDRCTIKSDDEARPILEYCPTPNWSQIEAKKNKNDK